MATKMTREEAVALLERYSNYDGMGIPNLAGCKEAMKVAVDALKEAFPDLAESEDERIRKRLIEYFEGFRMGNAEVKWEGLNVQEVLVWLEKQKECVSNNFDDVWDEEDCEEIIAEGQKLAPRFKELLKEVCHAWYDRGAKLEKQKEQKPVEKEITLTNFEETLNTFLFGFANSPIEDCEPKEYIKKHSTEILKAAYKELNATQRE